MNEAPNSFGKKTLMRAGVAGVVLAGIGIGAFLVIWILLGQAGTSDFPRLMASLCLPPALVAAVIGLYLLIIQPKSQDEA